MILNVRPYDTVRRELKVSDEIAKEIVLGMQEVAEEEHKKCAQKIEMLTKDFQVLKEYLDLRFDHIDKTFATKKDLADTKSHLVKWMFIFWTSLLTILFAFLYLFLKK